MKYKFIEWGQSLGDEVEDLLVAVVVFQIVEIDQEVRNNFDRREPKRHDREKSAREQRKIVIWMRKEKGKQ